MSVFNMVASMNESTVVSEYIPESRRSDSYQSEPDLEKEFIRMLTEQGYEYLQIHTEAELIANLRGKIEQLNSYSFTDTEWERFFHKYIANANEGIVEKTRTIQEDAVKNMERDDGHHDQGGYDVVMMILDFCKEARSIPEIMNKFGFDSRTSFRRKYLNILVKEGRLKMTLPDKPKSKNQKYYS